MKRFLCLLTALLAAASAVSCGSASDDHPTTTAAGSASAQETAAETKEPALIDSLGERDLEGYTYTIFDCNPYAAMHINMPGDKMTGEVVNDALFARDAALEDLYNIRIEYYQENKYEIIKKMVAAGEDTYQMIITPMTFLSGSATAGELANLCEVPHLEMDKEWWNPLLYENLRLKDAMYFTSSDIAPSIYQMPTCLFLNLKLYRDYAFDEDIFQTVIDGKWTLDLMKTMTKGLNNDLNADNKWMVDDDFFGFAMLHSSEAVFTMMLGMGVHLSQLNEDKTSLECNLLNNPRALRVLEDMDDYFLKIGFKGEQNDFSDVLFAGDRALFYCHKLQTAAVYLRNMKEDYLILPAPKYNEEQESYYSFLSPHGSSFIAMPLTAQENENAGFVTEALARYSHQYVRPIAFDLVYKEKDSRDPRSAEVLDILLDNLYIDFAALYEFGNIGTALTSVVFDGKPMTSLLEKRQKLIGNAVAKFEEKWNPLG